MRIILDTNILLSALLSPLGEPAKLLAAWERKAFTLIASEELIAELLDVASRPFFKARLRPSATELLVAGIHDFSFYCSDLSPAPIAPDPKDSYLLAMAEASQAEFLVTGDKALLSLNRHKSTRIIAPAAMVELLNELETETEEHS
jgi:hypothetical protein